MPSSGEGAVCGETWRVGGQRGQGGGREADGWDRGLGVTEEPSPGPGPLGRAPAALGHELPGGFPAAASRGCSEMLSFWPVQETHGPRPRHRRLRPAPRAGPRPLLAYGLCGVDRCQSAI